MGKLQSISCLCPRGLRWEGNIHKVMAAGRSILVASLATGPLDIEWCTLNVIDVAAIASLSTGWANGGVKQACRSDGGSAGPICTIQSLSWSPNGDVLACATNGVSPSCTGIAAFVASTGAITVAIWL